MLPYGISDFRDVKLNNYYYIDKTHFIPKIELYGRYLYLIRPRRFGKSLFLNMLALYYDIFYKDEFEDVFYDCYIFKNQTKEASSYHILKFDFSAISTKGDIDKNFSDYCNSDIKKFITKYKLNTSIDENITAHKNLKNLFDFAQQNSISIYIMIDEYDNFINNLLMHSQTDYQKLVSSKDEAIYKEFFKLLKAGTSDNSSALKKMFITGVSPLAMYDVTSGSNIGTNITNEYAFNSAVGVTKDELQKLLNHYKIDSKLDIDDWYNNYKFNRDIKESIYNTDMILYYLKSLYLTNRPPDNMVDLNVRTDYSKLRYLVYTDNKLNGNFSLLQELFGNGYITTLELKDSFSAFELKKTSNFVSLLYYLGLVTIDKYYRGEYYLKIPNQTIKRIMGEYIQTALEESDIFDIDLSKFKKSMQEFAYDGSLNVFTYLANEIKERSKVRDYTSGESFVKGFLIAYLGLSPYYGVLSEVERNKGFVDILLKKAPNIDDDIFEGLIELKYISRNKFTQDELDKQVIQAKKQLVQYNPEGFEIGVVVVFNGWEMVYCKIFSK
ncbi:hypothetical protein MNB_SV-15-1272 [hydrothermal vent metagenome]|uniref:AAA-ATPase-like domain-containing protein n=1 Tax=hydrothermal vent metagenome TaxID=652676 RepID=A0A1W1ELP3_9ZZZZ